jgi:hypothetical protein
MDSAVPTTDSHASGTMPALHGVTMCDVSETECRCVLDPAATVSEGVIAAVRRAMTRDGRDAGLVDVAPLTQAVDPDSLERLFARSDGAVSIEFQHEGYRVVVEGGERVVLCRDGGPTAP